MPDGRHVVRVEQRCGECGNSGGSISLRLAAKQGLGRRNNRAEKICLRKARAFGHLCSGRTQNRSRACAASSTSLYDRCALQRLCVNGKDGAFRIRCGANVGLGRYGGMIASRSAIRQRLQQTSDRGRRSREETNKPRIRPSYMHNKGVSRECLQRALNATQTLGKSSKRQKVGKGFGRK